MPLRKPILLTVLILFWGQTSNVFSQTVLIYPTNKAQINPKTTLLLDKKEKGLGLKPTAASRIDSINAPHDVSLKIKAPKSGVYLLESKASLTTNQPKEGKIETLFIKLQIDKQRPTKRIVYDSWNAGSQVLGKFQLSGENQELKIWLPKELRLEQVSIKEYVPPKVPTAAATYQPAITPPATHPRLWVNQHSLPIVKARLTSGENEAVWKTTSETALRPYAFQFDPQKEIGADQELEKVAETKAFYYLMTNDQKVGKEAVQLIRDYLSVLEFGNVKFGDITREVGRAIYTTTIVYDWCYALLSPEEKSDLYNGMMRLAAEMEIGWPPFDDSIINGHGNEAQVNRDLLAMSIALYDENPEPYRYCSYLVLEQLVPMRKFEYQSPRHNQGVDYGAYRFGWEMHAAWLFYRMMGSTVFDDNIKKVPYYWLYMRLPDGQMLRDGDTFGVDKSGKSYYWKQPQTMLLSYAYSNDPILKGEFLRQGGLPANPILYLLLNDPELKAQPNLESLPLSKDSGPILGSMIARTGWNMGSSSNDVVAEIKGGGYHFGNHQHADAGALQIYYRGQQVTDLGLYISYGIPYDFNFNKRSIAHSMMLAIDPNEKLHPRTKSNDGGTRFNQIFPKTPKEATSNPILNNGTVLSSDFGPSQRQPDYSYFKVDLTAAYTSKMTSYSRGFCFLNLGRSDVPAVVLLTDDMTTADSSFKKYWQINTLNLPENQNNNLVLQNQRNGLVGKTHVQMLVPASTDRTTEILSGEKATSVFGIPYKVTSKQPEANGHRILISPKNAQRNDRFLTLFQMTADTVSPLPVVFNETEETYQIQLADRIVVMAKESEPISKPFTLKVPKNGRYQVLITGANLGFWNVKGNQVNFNSIVDPGKNTLYFSAKEGEYVVSPGRAYDVNK